MKRLWHKGPFFQEASKKNHVALIRISIAGAGRGILTKVPSEAWLSGTFKTETDTCNVFEIAHIYVVE